MSLEGEVKLADFGVSAQITQSVTKRHSFVGTPYWMAPEVITQSEYDQRADIWSVGITAIELAKGEPPLAHLTPMKALFQIQSSPPPAIDTSFSAAFQDFTKLCLQRDPLSRPDAETLLKHKFIASAKKISFLTDLLDTTTSISHYRSSSTIYPTVVRAEPDTVHRHSRSSEEGGKVKSKSLKAVALHRKISSLVSGSRSSSSKGSRSSSTSNSVKAVDAPDAAALQELEDQYKLQDSFLGCMLYSGLEMAVTSVQSEKDTEPALEALVVAVAKMEMKARGLAERIFLEATRLLQQSSKPE